MLFVCQHFRQLMYIFLPLALQVLRIEIGFVQTRTTGNQQDDGIECHDATGPRC